MLHMLHILHKFGFLQVNWNEKSDLKYIQFIHYWASIFFIKTFCYYLIEELKPLCVQVATADNTFLFL